MDIQTYTETKQFLTDEEINTLHQYCINKSLFVATPQMAGLENKNCFILGNPLDKDNYMVYYNPKIVAQDTLELSEEYIDYKHYKLLSLKIKRFKNIRVRFYLNDGKTYTEKYTGYTSIYFQQGLDLLQGVNVFTKTHKLHRDKAIKKHSKLSKQIHQNILG